MRPGEPPRLFDHEPGTDVAVPEDQPADRVLQGEVVETPRPRAAVATVRAVVTDVATHHRTKTAARHVLYVGAGATVVARRLWDSRTAAPYVRAMRSAEAAGNQEAMLEWEARRSAFRRDQHSRRMDLIGLPLKVAAALPKVTVGAVAILIFIGTLLAIADHDAHQVTAPLFAVADFVRLVVLIVTVGWSVLLLLAFTTVTLALWSIGRSHAPSNSGWIARLEPEQADGGMVVTADTVVLALQHLRIPELKKAFKDGWIPAVRLPPVRDGRGYHTIFELPLGVTAQMIADQRPVLARNLRRAEVEVWPADAEKVGTGPAGAVDLWVADAGALSKPAPEYPLLHEGAADVFTGVPIGVSPRGDALTAPVVANNFVAGGMMGQGKSNACRVIVLGAALDPLSRLWVHVFAGNGDFDAYQPRLERYHRGATDDVTAAGLQSLRDLYVEVGRREDRLAELGAKKVTRQLAERHADLRPIVALFSECHELFGHKEFGEEAVEMAAQTLRRARKAAIWMGFDTQDARADAIPPKIVSLVSINSCFYVKTWRANDGFLGDGSFQAGIRATELRPGRDRGTSLITGVSDAPFELLKWYFVEVNDDTGWDAATDVVARAVAQMAAGTPAAGAGQERPAIESRDLLEDLVEVLGAERARIADVPALLRDLAPSWAPYKALTGTQLRAQLAELGVPTTNTANVPKVNPAEVRRALAERSE